MLPTSHVKVSGGRVAHPGAVAGHALVLALVRLLAALDLQPTCEGRRDGSTDTSSRLCWLCRQGSSPGFVVSIPPPGSRTPGQEHGAPADTLWQHTVRKFNPPSVVSVALCPELISKGTKFLWLLQCRRSAPELPKSASIIHITVIPRNPSAGS